MRRPKPKAPVAGTASLAEVRRSIVEAARQSEDLHTGALEAARAGRGVMQAPPRLAKRELRHGGGYISRGASDYDWFYGLSKTEQRRLRENWFSHESTAETPDEIATRIDLKDWLDHTRRADAARALATGRHVETHRYGGLDPNSLIAGTPYDVRKIWGDDHAAAAHIAAADRHAETGRGDRPEFYTDARGVVHPIRATQPENRWKRYATSGAVDYGDDEAF